MYQMVMVPLDGSELAECVLPHVETIARGSKTKNVILVRVVEPLYGPADAYAAWSGMSVKQAEMQKQAETERENEAKKYLKQVAERLDCGGANVQTKMLTGRPAETLSEYAVKNDADLIIIATHGRSGVSRWARGSVADRILHAACAPVLMVRAPGCVPNI